MVEISMTPSGALRLEIDDLESNENLWQGLYRTFRKDWREGLFLLAAGKVPVDDSHTLPYWRGFAEQYLTRLCHIPEEMAEVNVVPPSQAEVARFVLSAPPMQGGEYVTPERIRKIWDAMDAWVHTEISRVNGLPAFLRERAPRWRQVGRVCFHLAENKNNARYPFAFMASFSSGYTPSGQLKYLPLNRALELYAGEKNRAAIIKLLSPVHRAGEKCRWVKHLIETRQIYRPVAWKAEQAYAFLKSVELIEQAGIAVRLPNWWENRPRISVNVTIGEKRRSRFGANALLDFNVQITCGGEVLSREELQALLAQGDGLVRVKGNWIELDREKLQTALAHWESIHASVKEGAISFYEGMRLLAGAPREFGDDEIPEMAEGWFQVRPGEALREILARLRDPSRLAPTASGNGVFSLLRPYQKEGFAWLSFLSELGLGACLADDMGLGKTIQVLALLESIREHTPPGERVPSLLIIPASLLGNWRNEAERFTPELKLLFLHPSEIGRKRLEETGKSPEKHLAGIDLVVTTYAMLIRQRWLLKQKWRLVILDEAQAIRNPATRQSRAAKNLKADARLALTGTPIENRLLDLWSLFDFLNPGLLGNLNAFKRFVKDSEYGGKNRYAPIRRLITPYLLRRMKTDKRIIADLPDKTEIRSYCSLSKKQVALYEKTVSEMARAMAELSGIERRGLILQVLMRLKQICNHPAQFLGDGDYTPGDSGKFMRLREICEELAERQEKVLVFTQFREIIDPIAEFLASVFGRDGLTLHGSTPVSQRRGLVKRFQSEDGPPFFVLSLKAGGTGLNLTAASHVIHFDRWWNPAVENQATDRAFRIGQKKNVFVHKFLTRGTLEEHIDALIEDKKSLARELISPGGEIKITEMTDEQVIELISLDATKVGL